MDGGGKHLGEGAEPPDEFLGDQLDVAARNGAEQHTLQELVVGQGFAAVLGEAGAQTVAVAVVMRRVFARSAHARPAAATVSRR